MNVNKKTFTNIAKYWIVPLIVSFFLFLFIRSTLAFDTTTDPLEDYVNVSNVNTGKTNINGRTQVYFEFQNQKYFISDSNLNSFQPSTAGRYIVYVSEVSGENQIFLYNLISKTKLQLTNSGTNQKPQVSKNGIVVWERWIPEEDGWQVMLYDGISKTQLTKGDLSMNPYTEGEYIIYGRRDLTGQWRAVAYSLQEEKEADISFGEETKKPRLIDGKIIFADGKTSPLKVEDFFLLNLGTLKNSDSIDYLTVNDILKELSE